MSITSIEIVTLFTVIILVVIYVMSRSFSVSTAIVIDREQVDVFNYIKLLGNQEKYTEWATVSLDPNAAIQYKGIDGTVGFTVSWQSDIRKVGSGEQEITRIETNECCETEIRFSKPVKVTSRTKIRTESLSAHKTKVTMTFTTSAPFPLNIIMRMMNKKLVANMNENAANLKKILEN